MTDIAYRTASELARMIRERAISSEQLLEQLLARLARFNPALNAVVVTDLDAARRRAREADAALARGESWGPLHGVPMTVKETYEVAGMPTTAGAPELREHRSTTNAVAVQRLLDAGAVIFGKTNVPLYAGDLQSYNEIYGTTNNPWDLERTPGGSSGGSAAALAAGLTPLELGSDIGGSIRTPSHFCGVCGLKPSYGVIPVRGHVPGPPGSLSRADIGVMGPMARSVDDLALALDVLAGPDSDDAAAWRLELPPPRRGALAEYRVAAWLDDPFCPVDADIVAALGELIARLRAQGVAVDDQARPVELAANHETFSALLAAALSAGLPPKVFDRLVQVADTADAGDKNYLAQFARNSTQRHARWLRTNEKRQHLRKGWEAFFQRFDVLLCPVVQTPAFRHDQSQPVGDRTLTVNGRPQPYMDILVWAGLAGASYLPAAVVPVGRTRDGLPVGVQIIAPYLQDRTALDFARHVERLLGGFAPPPGYAV